MGSCAMPLDKYHLAQKGDKWRLEKAKSNRAVVSADTKAEAMDKMQNYMKTHSGSVRIHKQDGTIQEERTYPGSKDPRKTPG